MRASFVFLVPTAVAALMQPAYADELDDLGRAVDDHPTNPEAYDAFARAAFKAKRYDDAIRRLRLGPMEGDAEGRAAGAAAKAGMARRHGGVQAGAASGRRFRRAWPRRRPPNQTGAATAGITRRGSRAFRRRGR